MNNNHESLNPGQQPPTGGKPNGPDWRLQRQIAVLMILAGFALLIGSL